MIASPAAAADIIINPGDSIQDAIDGAVAGDTIVLNAGTYSGYDITVTKDITIRANTASGGSAANTIIDAGGSGRIFFVTRGTADHGRSLTIDSLTLRNGKALDGSNGVFEWENGGDGENGGAIESFGTVTVTSSVITACSAGNGGSGGPGGWGGPGGTGGTGGSGGAINSTYEVTVTDTTITDCHAGNGGTGGEGAGDIPEGGPGGLGGSGGAISSDYPITAALSTISGCTAGDGGTGGAGGHNDDPRFTVYGTGAFGGRAGNGGAINSLTPGTVTVTASTFTGCSAGTGGTSGAPGGPGASSNGGGDGGNGGAIASSHEVSIDSSTMSSCSAGPGGTGVSDSPDGYGGGGGAIYGFNEGSVSATGSTFSGNNAGDGRTNTVGGPGRTDGGGPGGYGGAIHLYAVSNSRVDAVSSIFENNAAGNSGRGGAIAGTSDAALTIYATSSTFSGNSASTGDATYSWFGDFHFNRIYGHTNAAIVSASTDSSHGISATNNWWGSNGNPSAYVSGYTTYNPWLVLGADALPGTITMSDTSAIRANLTFNSAGSDTSSSGYVPDGITAAFATADGSVLPASDTTTDGVAETAFAPSQTGISTVSATVDGESVTVPVLVAVTAGFTGTPVRGPYPHTVAFTDTSTCTTPLMWNWSFGDGSWFNTTDIAERSPSHTYTTTGGYTVALTIADAFSSNTSTQVAYIVVTFPPPTIALIDPPTGFNSTTIDITNLAGMEFNTTFVPDVRLNRTGHADIAATNVLAPSSTQITCTFDLSFRASGLWNVVVTNPDGQEGMLVDAFEIQTPAPAIGAIDPATGYNTTTVDIDNLSGTGFWPGSATEVKLSRAGQPDIVATGVGVLSGTRIACTFDLADSEPGTWDLTVTNPDGRSATLPDGFNVTVPVPALTSITPDSGYNTTTIRITDLAGSGFWPGSATGVKLNRTGSLDIIATSVSVPSVTQITCRFPLAGAGTGLWNVVVTNPDGQEDMLANGFRVMAVSPTEAPVSSDSDNTAGGPVNNPSAGTVTVNIGGNSAVWQVVVTGTGVSDLIVTGMTIHAGDTADLPPGQVYQYIEIVPARFATITGAEIFFSVPESWLAEHRIDPRTIVLYHLTADGWVALPTTVVETKDGKVYFSATTTGFSRFAIAGTEGSLDAGQQFEESSPLQQQAGTQPTVATARTTRTATPAVTQTTAAPPAASPIRIGGFPLTTIALIGAGCVVLVAGGWWVRRWWIRRQNPALFADYDD